MEFNRTFFGKKFTLTLELPYNEKNCGYIKVENHEFENFKYYESFTWCPFVETLDERLQDIQDELSILFN